MRKYPAFNRRICLLFAVLFTIVLLPMVLSDAPSVVIQYRGGDNCTDTMITPDQPTTNLGAVTSNSLGPDGSGDAQYWLIQWANATKDIPPGSTINWVKFQFTRSSAADGSGMPVLFYPLNKSWDENVVTWNSYACAEGGCYNSSYTIGSIADITAYTDTNVTLNATYFQRLLDRGGEEWNNGKGIILYHPAGNNQRVPLHTSETATLTNKPTLYINYTEYTNMTIEVYNNRTNTSINDFNATIGSTVYTTNSGLITTGILSNDPVTYEITLNSLNYHTKKLNWTPTSGNLNTSMVPANDLNFVFYDEETNKLLENTTVDIDIFNSMSSYNASGNVSIYVVYLDYGVYTLRYSAPGYYERFYYLNFETNDEFSINLYLINSSVGTEVSVTMYDQNNQLLPDAYIAAMRFFPESNAYYTVEWAKTNFQGETNLHLQLNTEFYKFILYYPFGEIRQITSETYIYDNSLIFQLQTGQPVLVDYEHSMDITHSLVWLNDSNAFRLTFMDANNVISQACLEIYQTTAKGNVLRLNQTCVASTSGIITTGVPPINGTTYTATAYATISGTDWFLDSLAYTFIPEDYNPSHLLGLFLTFILTITLVWVFRFSVEIAVMMIPIPLILMSATNMILLPISVGIGLEVAAMILAFILNRVMD